MDMYQHQLSHNRHDIYFTCNELCTDEAGMAQSGWNRQVYPREHQGNGHETLDNAAINHRFISLPDKNGDAWIFIRVLFIIMPFNVRVVPWFC